MDLQRCLKTTLKKKYQKLNETDSENSSLPSRLCYREHKVSNVLSAAFEHEFNFVNNNTLQTWLALKTAPLKEVLSCDCKHNSSKRTVLTLGISGSGKTTTVQRCALDWAEEKEHHQIHLFFPLTFWELNLITQELSLVELLQTFYPELKQLDASTLNGNNIWFVLDGLDQYIVPLNFNCPTVTDASEVSTVDILLSNLIMGNLLSSAHVWITTRYAAASQIPLCHLLKETEVQWFSDEQKEQHFRTVIGNDDLANKAIDQMKISGNLDFLCRIPSICTIIAHFFKYDLEPDDGFNFSPWNLTQIYTNLIGSSDIIDKLEKLALLWMEEGNVMYEHDLLKCDISVEEASALSKECPPVLIEERGLHNTTVFRFGHWSIQQYLAASAKLRDIELSPSKSACCQDLVDKALQSAEGKYDVFLRFIFGLIYEDNVLDPTDQLFEYTRKKILENTSVSLFYCLREYDSIALLDEVRFFLKYGFSPISDIVPKHFTLLMQKTCAFEGIYKRFQMQVSERCDQRLLQQLPAVLKSRNAVLQFSNLTDKCCQPLAAILSTRESYLKELDLGYNGIGDNGVRALVKGLSDQRCRLKVLSLKGCGMTSQACKYLATALTQSWSLRELNLCNNDIGDDGLHHLSSGLGSLECHLETLKLSQCSIKQSGCHHLASALQKNSSHLKVLDLSINMVGDKGANELFEKFDISKLRKLEMYHCGLTVLSCKNIGEALKSESSNLVEFNLSNNNLKDAGFAVICEGMRAWCSVEKLNVSRCGITDIGCFYLANVLCSVSQLYSSEFMQKTDWQAVELKDLDLSMNCLKDHGVKQITAGLTNPYSHLKALNLSHCSLTDDCCAALASGLASSNSIISKLDLSGNSLQDKGARKLCLGLRSPHCKLEILSLQICGLTSRSVQFLTSALKSNPEHLTELHLMGNSLEDSDIRVLMELTKSRKYALKLIDVSADL
ncbi:NACHT, LRR and PYD domains-containing protein 14 [Channa argus]|uniref:NACHT, LRR and PYD domains-containing protein 14 n=1 Tax=Channa argus TaxID=215402 RepID=A0A6G1PAB5_CHAAH|nr:NACHT, LRR and PYD domains-containing protein 14 [Channa argus]